ncbi:MAG: EthD domain-containing protein [Deltaproteobacteria bacterium]|nr:EthD domain-containing protein [Deltaproteobacteria bacterium]
MTEAFRTESSRKWLLLLCALSIGACSNPGLERAHGPPLDADVRALAIVLHSDSSGAWRATDRIPARTEPSPVRSVSTFEGENLEAVMAALAAATPERGSVVGLSVGWIHRIEGSSSERNRYLYLIHTRSGVELARFHEHWRSVHAPLRRGTPGTQGYEQLHVDPPATRRAADRLGVPPLDAAGIAVLHLTGPDSLLTAVDAPRPPDPGWSELVGRESGFVIVRDAAP